MLIHIEATLLFLNLSLYNHHVVTLVKFLQVISLNFHPFYSNDKEIYHLEHFHADYTTLKFQENILTKGTEKFTKVSCYGRSFVP